MRHSELALQVRAYDSDASTASLIERAYAYGERMHGTQKRATGEPYFTHPVAVANILTGLRLDPPTIVTALLHDTLEDTDATYGEIRDLFGEEIANLVQGVTKLTRLELSSEGSAQAENFRKLLLATSEDVRVLLVKLADRMHNMRTLEYVKPQEKRQRIAQETMDIFAPLAGRMGLQGFRNELENHAFAFLNPEIHSALKERLERIRAESGDLIAAITEQLQSRFATEQIKAEVSSREKGLYAIWRKMERNDLALEQLSDITGFRIILERTEECYRTLGIVHCAWKSVPERFKDYISTPKANGYQSIHTTVVGPEQKRVELQIRTRKMHREAEYGIAAHWAYKEGAYKKNGVHGTAKDEGMKQFAWLRQLVEMLDQNDTPEEFLEHTKLELFRDQVFCFTPKGVLIALPRGATPLDFAYAVHTDIGDTCVGCRINGQHLPLRRVLNNGDQVEIIRSRGQSPLRGWEQMVVTGKARSAIRRALRKHQSEENVEIGRRMLEATFEQAGYQLTDQLLERVLGALQQKNLKALCAAVGRGKIDRNEVLTTVYPQTRSSTRTATKIGVDRLPIRGVRPGTAMHFAEGVFPVPGDRIVGIFTPGRGIVIYPLDSPKLRDFDNQPERWSDVEWDDNKNGDAMFTARVSLILLDKVGTLTAITSLIADFSGNISNLQLQRNESDFCNVQIDIEVRDLTHFNQIFSALQGLSVIARLRRISG